MNKIIITTSITLILTAGVNNNVNAALVSNAVLDFNDGITSCVNGGTPPDGCVGGLTTVLSGSYFGVDGNGDQIIENIERVALTNAGAGLTLASAQDIGDIDNAWPHNGYLGYHYTKVAPTVISATSNTATINMSGWNVWWGDPAADQIPNWASEGSIATVTCGVDCSVNDSFVLEYYIPNIDPWSLVPYTVHLEGTISAVPVPAAVWLFGSGLICLVGLTRRST